jgi:predicted nucleotidyltransferase
MNLETLRKFTPQLNQIAQKHGIEKLYVFGSIARGEATSKSDVDFLVEMEPKASLFGVAGFSFEAEKLLALRVDVIPASLLPEITDRVFVQNIQREVVAL